MRTSKTELQQLVTVLNNRAPKRGHRYELDRAYGSYRLVLAQTKSPYGAQEISPRLPAKALALWISAFIDGVGACRR